MEFKKYGDGTMNELLVSLILSIFGESNNKQDIINWLKTVWENMGYASSKLFQIVKNEGDEALQGFPRWLQAALTDVWKNSPRVNETFSLVGMNSLNRSDILRNTVTADTYWSKNTLKEMDYLNNILHEMNILRHRLSNARQNGLSESCNNSTAKGSDRGMSVSSNKFNHSKDPVYCSIPKIDAQYKRVLRNLTTDLEYTELKMLLSAIDQCTVRQESSGNIASRSRDDFEDTYFNIERYINNQVVASSPKLDAFRCEFRLQMTSETIASIIKEKGMTFFSKNQKASKHRTGRYRLVVVSSADFEEAMRQSDIDTVVLADDIRMFISIPVYRNGYIHSKAK